MFTMVPNKVLNGRRILKKSEERRSFLLSETSRLVSEKKVEIDTFCERLGIKNEVASISLHFMDIPLENEKEIILEGISNDHLATAIWTFEKLLSREIILDFEDLDPNSQGLFPK